MTGCQRNHLRSVRQWGRVACFLVVAAAAPGLGSGDGGAGPVEVDRAVASIGGIVITDSRLQFEARVLLVMAHGVEAAHRPLDREALSRALQLMIDQRLATFEADRLQAYPVEQSEVDQDLQTFRERFLSEDRFRTFLASHEAELTDLAEVLRLKRRAEKVLEGKFKLRAQVSDTELQRALRERPAFRNLSPEAARSRLTAERFAQLVRVELVQARRSTDVRLLGPFAPIQGGGP